MPLKIEMTPWDASPVILCDHCGEVIADARHGNAQWLAETEAGAGTVLRYAFFTHKRCSHPFERARGGAAAWYAMELADLVSHLALALRLDRDAERQPSDTMRGLM